LLSRATVFEFKSVSPEDISPAVERAFAFLGKESGNKLNIEDGVVTYICQAVGGDVRKSLNAVELSVLAATAVKGKQNITLENAKILTQRSAMRYDKSGDEHYDIVSAFQKSMRGSDANAAIHYLARLLEAGDLPSACRRLMVCACEDVGLAYPQIIPIVKAAIDAAQMVGLPEARIPLADAVILVCNAPKSNSAYLAIGAAMADIQKGKSGPVPRQLQNKHFDGEDNENKGQFYEYPHDSDSHWVKQQYLPNTLKNAKYYEYGDNRNEQAAKEYWDKIKK
jgi:putative ATPase